jgi:hypothetical protein
MRRVKVPRLALAPPAVPAPRPALAPHRSQWAGCGYACIAWGRGLGEELVCCGYAYPVREILFLAGECTD